MDWQEILSNVIDNKINILGREPSSLSDLIFLQDNKVLPEEHAKSFKYLLELSPKKILEIGCGNGSVLYLFDQNNSSVYRIDYVKKSIEISSRIMPKGKFQCSTADDIPFNETFDLILSNSVFQYFENLEYAKKVIVGALAKLEDNGNFIITDLPDANTKEEFKSFRMIEMGLNETDWQKRYAQVDHLYYDYGDLRDFIENMGYKYNFIKPSKYLSKHQAFKFDIWIKKI